MGYKLGSPKNSRVEGTVGIWKLQCTQYSVSAKIFFTNLLQQGHHTKHTSQFAHSNVDDIEEVFNSSRKPLLFRSHVSFGHRNNGVLPSMTKKHVSALAGVSDSFRSKHDLFACFVCLWFIRVRASAGVKFILYYAGREGWLIFLVLFVVVVVVVVKKKNY